MYEMNKMSEGKIKSPLEIKEFSKIDLTKHAVIEASAGTGKTYTIENIVIELLKRDVPLEKILVVTFTEKATGELLDRIRIKLQTEIDNLLLDKTIDENEKQQIITILKDSLDHFEGAQISTLHGFCQRILREYAFESNRQFDYEITDDEVIYRTVLKQIIRKDWSNKYGENLFKILKLSSFPGKNARNEKSWEKTVLQIAKNWKPESNEQLLPKPEKKFNFDFLNQKLLNVLKKNNEEIGKLDCENIENSELLIGYNQLNFHRTSKNNLIKKVVKPLLELLCVFNSGNFDGDSKRINAELFSAAYNFSEVALSYMKEAKRNANFDYLVPTKWNKKGNNLSQVCPNLETINEKLKLILDWYENLVKLQLKLNTIVKLKEDVAEYKEKHGLMSYSDMLLFLWKALKGNDKQEIPEILAILRKRFSYALVDEAQDTDLIQWQILREIFVTDSDKTGNCLFLIGDPKQAIYSFRGADVYVYLKARYELVNKIGGGYYSLNTNWRSIPELIKSFNNLFEQEDWRFEKEHDYQYLKSPESSKLRAKIKIDKSGRNAMNFVELNSNTASFLKNEMANFIAKEIERLLENPMIVERDGQTKQISADDICILIRKQNEASYIEKKLDGRGIPHSYYKKSGLYQTDEAYFLSIVLNAIVNPSDISSFRKALLTPFFSISVDKLSQYEDLPADHKIKQFFFSWQEWAVNREWPPFFKSILEDTGYIYRAYEKNDGERIVTNMHHLIQEIQEHAIRQKLDIIQINDHLKNLINKQINIEKDADLQRLETEFPKVKIMTIHAAKGLEFPIVFIAGGYTSSIKSDNYYKIHDPKQNNAVVYDLLKKKSNGKQFKIEQMQDEKRLFYVAFTRAIYKLYIPYCKIASKKSGPLKTFIRDSIVSIYIPLKTLKKIEIDNNEQRTLSDAAQIITLPKPLLPENGHYFWHRIVKMNSFSSLKDHSSIKIENIADKKETLEFGDSDKDNLLREDDDETETLDEKINEIENENLMELPRGKDIGTLVHAVLELIDFELVQNSASYANLLDEKTTSNQLLDNLLINFFQKHKYVEMNKFLPFKKLLAKMVWNVLNIKLPPHDIILGKIPVEKRKAEVEFYYPLLKENNNEIPDTNIVANSFIKGFIDLVFFHGDYCYLIDWKTNYLENGYGQKELLNAMEHSNYILQYKLYAIAINRWLKQFNGKYKLAGGFYLFLRGINNRNDNGIYFHPISEDDEIKIYEEKLFKL